MDFDALTTLISTYKYIFLFPLAIIEGPILTIVAGFLTSLQVISGPYASLIIISGDLAGAMIYYFFGRYGGRNFISKWGHFFRLSLTQTEPMEKRFEKHAGKILIIGKFLPVINTVISVTAGLSRMRLRKFLYYNLISAILKTILLILIGFYFGKACHQFNDYSAYASLSLLLLISLVIGLSIFGKKMSKKYFKEAIR